MLSRISFKHKLLAGYGVVLALMLIITTVVFFSVKSLVANFFWVNHTHDVLATASKIEAAAVDMETGMRGYLLAGKDGFLTPYSNGKQTFNNLISELSNTVSDNPSQIALLADISKTIAQWQTNITEPSIELRRQIGNAKTMNDMSAVIKQAKGKQYFDKFREQMALFISREKALMTTRQDQAKTSTNITQLKQLSQWVEHTHEVIGSAQAIVASAVDMETGMRGFLLAGDDAFLAPYKSGKSDFYQLIATLTTTVSDNPAQVTLLNDTKTTITNWISLIVEKKLP